MNDLPTDADMKFAAEIDNLGDYTRAKRIRQYVNAENAKLLALLRRGRKNALANRVHALDVLDEAIGTLANR